MSSPPKKSVHLAEGFSASFHEGHSLARNASVASSAGILSRLAFATDGSPDRPVSMWRDAPDFRGERVTDQPSTSGASLPAQKRQQAGRRQLHTQPAASGSPGGRRGPSNLSRLLPDIRGGGGSKPHSTPSSPVGARAGQGSLPSLAGSPSGAAPHRTSLNGASTGPGFIAGATVAGPISQHSHGHGQSHGHGGGGSGAAGGGAGAMKTAAAAAALFAMAGGSTIAAASIAYNAPPSPGMQASVSGEAAGPGASAGAGGGVGGRGAASPEPGAAAGSSSRTGTAGALGVEGSTLGEEAGGEEDEEGGGLGTSHGGGMDDGDEAMMAENPRLRGRLVALPNILCRSANGDVFLVELSNVQAMLAKKDIGDEGIGILGRITPSLVPGGAANMRRRRKARQAAVAAAIDGNDDDIIGAAGGDGDGLHRNASMMSRNSQGQGGGAGGGGSAGAGGGGGRSARGGARGARGRDALMEAEVLRHVAATEAAVEAKRAALEADWRAGRANGVSAAVVAKEVEEAKRAAAIEFAVNVFVPRKLAVMALNMRAEPSPPAGEKEGSKRAAGKPESAFDAPTAVPGGGAAFGAGFKAARLAAGPSSGWGKMQAGLDRMYERMPFLPAWADAVKRLRRDDEVLGWDDLLGGGLAGAGGSGSGSGLAGLGVAGVYVKGRNEHQGTNIYVLKCQELGVTPSTQVVQQLSAADANMGHCNLGRQGAAALRHALSANMTITHLNLCSNQLDSTAVQDILAGLYNGTMAKHPQARKMLERRLQAPGAAGGGGFAAGGAAAGGGGSKSYLPQPSRKAPGDLNVRLIPSSLAKEQEQRRQTEEERARAEAAARAAEEEAEAAAAAASSVAAASGLADAPEWLRIINDPARLAALDAARARNQSRGGSRGLLGGSPPAGSNRSRSPNLPARRGGGGPSGGGGPAGGPRITSMTSLITSMDLSENPLGLSGVRAIADLLDPTVTPYQFLKHLWLNKCGIPEAGGRALGVALSRGNITLSVLGLSNNGLGNKSAAVVGELLAGACALEELDLSWNHIKADGAAALASGLAQNNKLARLNLSWNGLENEGVCALGSMLGRNDCLSWLDLTNTRMGAEACLMLSEGIKSNHALEVLILNGNSVGDDGARFLMDALKSNTSLQYLGLQGSNMSAAVRGHSGGNAFNPLSPDGTYVLNLAHGPDRAVAQQLCELDAASGGGDLMKNIRLNDKNVASCRAMKWPDCLPTGGMLTCDFVSKRASKAVAVMEAKKFNALAAQFDAGTMSDKEKLGLVEVMAPFNYLYCHQAATLLRTFTIGDEMVLAAALLFSRCADLEDSITALSTALKADTSQDSLHEALGWYSYVRFSNPTGHYELNLCSKVHQALATRLKDVAYSEPVEALNWINVIHDMYTTSTKVPNNFGPPEGWKGLVPHSGTLSFDYVSGVWVGEDTPPVSDQLLADVLQHDLGIPLDPQGAPVPTRDAAAAGEQVARLRPLVANMAFTTAQVRRLVEAFEAPPHRVEVLVVTFCLIVDRKNLWSLLYTLSPLEQALAMWRLGPANVFDRAHPTGHYILDLANPAHEVVARKLVELSLAQPDLPNFWNIRINGSPRAVHENRNMWGTFTSETASPFMEFDFIGADGFEVLGRSKQEVDALGPGDRLDLRTKQARRMELGRLKAMYPYYEDGSGWARPGWCSRPQLMQPLADKAPWQAAWDRMTRVLLRYDLRCGGMEGDSPLEDMYFTATNGEEAMTGEAYEALLRDWGYGRLEVAFMREAFDAAGRQATPADGPAWKPILPTQSGAVSTSGGVLGSVSGATTPAGALSRATSAHPSHAGVAAAAAAALAVTCGEGAAGGGGAGGGAIPESPGAALLGLSGAVAAAAGGGAAVAQPIPNIVVDFPTFVRVFMNEPPRALRFMVAATAVTAAAGVAVAAAKTMRGRAKGR
ncbi:hypothetical protein HYH02_010310 [Chlamydomonas schloesseri]|uniref:DUF4476 domain-containing protein n=1 Tax=Chlamydomonas schloesseri TaxID=2026947 RepID=A0A835T821_9CHLO|nr:hypothetical protein HYH02_010310 [Chlamydomonas schloesseri]|eukprot:KAG2440423.1 hypothetical protein HYH02_010310 [Chlamydomonas schloesseri]